MMLNWSVARGMTRVGFGVVMTFFVTFSQKHGHEPHPSGLQAHPDGYWTITAPSFREALNLTRSTFGRFGFSNVLNDKQFEKSAYLRGELGCLKTDHKNEKEPNTAEKNGFSHSFNNGFANGAAYQNGSINLKQNKPALETQYQQGEFTIRIDLSRFEALIKNHKDYVLTDVDKLGLYLADHMLELLRLDAIEKEEGSPIFKQLLETCLTDACRADAGLEFVGDDWMN